MAAANHYTTALTNLTANPPTMVDRRDRGVVRVARADIDVTSAMCDDVGDKIHLVSVPSHARILRINLRNEDLDSHGTPTLAVDVGAYYSGIGHNDSTKTLATVIDADAFASAITTLQSANLAGTDVRVEATDTIDECGMEVWEAAGLSADCGGEVLISLTVTAAAATFAAGRIVVDVTYVA